MQPLSCFGRFVLKVLAFSSDSFDQKTTQIGDDSCKVTSASQFLCKLYKKLSFRFCKHYEKYIVSKEYCSVYHDDKMCFLLNLGIISY